MPIATPGLLRLCRLVASAPMLSQLWQVASPAQLKDCVLHYVWMVQEEHQAQGPWWEG